MSTIPAIAPSFAWQGEAPDPLGYPDYYRGIVLRRICAHLLDLFLIVVLVGFLFFLLVTLNVLTFGLLLVPLLLVGPVTTVLYDSLQVGGRHAATLGMRAFGVEVRSWTGNRPEFPQALLRAIVFWGLSYMTATLLMWVVLGMALFNTRRRCLHDYLSGTVVIRSLAVIVISP
ncbi:MAG TPA: RDD family protein [Alphaproteobacteria bacterium]|nr:RDD family protein [Alphaproteobacteria bacterium]